jgi:hypothetical protein
LARRNRNRNDKLAQLLTQVQRRFDNSNQSGQEKTPNHSTKLAGCLESRTFRLTFSASVQGGFDLGQRFRAAGEKFRAGATGTYRIILGRRLHSGRSL